MPFNELLLSVGDFRIDGSEMVSIAGIENATPGQNLGLRIARADGTASTYPLMLRLDTPSEIEYAKRGGILSYVLEIL